MTLEGVRSAASAAFEKSGFPGPRDEAWRFTPTRGWARRAPLADPHDVDLSDRWYVREDVPRLVLVDGRFDARWSRAPSGVERIDQSAALGDLLPGDGGFSALTLADFTGGAWVRGAGEVLLVHHTTGGGVVPVRHRLEVPDNSTLSVCTWFEGAPGASLAATGTEVIVGSHATLRWVDLQDAPAEGHAVHLLSGRIGAHGALDGGLVGLGAAVARAEVRVTLAEDASLSLTGLALGRGSRHQDFHTLVHHEGARSRSKQRFKAILDGTARGVYTGRVVVGAGVPGCDVSQRSAALLLSDRAIANTRPQLEIHCDDVAASHGSTVGQLDAEALFFLAARGLDPREAAALLTTAFANDAIDALPIESVREAIRARVTAWLQERP